MKLIFPKKIMVTLFKTVNYDNWFDHVINYDDQGVEYLKNESTNEKRRKIKQFI